MDSILANAIELFTKYQVAKLTNENIDVQEFAYSEQQKRADFVDERNLPKNEKIDIESILDSLYKRRHQSTNSVLGSGILFCVSSGRGRSLQVLQHFYISQE